MKRYLLPWYILMVVTTHMLLQTQSYAQAVPEPNSHVKIGAERIDSLLAMLPTLQDDSNKAILLGDLSYSASTIGEADKGLQWAEEARVLSVKLGFKKGESSAYNCLGVNYWIKHDYLMQQKCFLQALNIVQTLNDKRLMGGTLRNVGNIYQSVYNYPKALEYYKKALTIAEEINNPTDIIAFLFSIAGAYDAQKNYREALACYRRIETFLKKLGWVKDLGGTFRRMGLTLANQGNYAEALKCEKKGLELTFRLREDVTYKHHYKWGLRALGTVYFQKGDYRQSLIYFRKAFNRFRLLTDVYSNDNTGICLGKMGKSYLHIVLGTARKNSFYYAQLKNAEDTLVIAVAMLKPNDWASLTEVLQDLSAVYRLSGNYTGALEAYQQYSIYKDSLNNTETEKKIIVQEMEYDNRQQKDSLAEAGLLQSARLGFLVQQKELEALRGKQRRIYIMVGLLSVCLVACYFLYRNHLVGKGLQIELDKERITRRLQLAENERDISQATLTALVAQMNPHFLFNALNTVQGFIYSDDKKNASGYLGKFSDLTRRVLDNSNRKSISLDEELALLRLYLDIEKVRFGEDFVALLETDPGLDGKKVFLPPMLVQPYVENAIRHGLMHREGKKELRIQILKPEGENGMRIVIDDNGIGRERSAQINTRRTGHRSFASTATEKRINLINQTFGQKIMLHIVDKKDANGVGTGTTVMIVIPVTLNDIV